MGATANRVDDWRSLLDRHARIGCALENELQERHGIGASEFEVLDRIVEMRKPDGGDDNAPHCRMVDLSSVMYLSQSALSRAVARLEKDGLVERSICNDDRRVIIVGLTDEGARMHAAALPTHREVVARSWDQTGQ